MDSNKLAAELKAMLAPDSTCTYKHAGQWLEAHGPAILTALTQQPADHIPDASNMVPAERADDWQNPILTSDPRPPKNQLKPAPLSSLRVVPAEQIADGALGVTLDWRVVAKSAGTNGIRYRTNTALLHFLSEIMPLAQQARAQALEEAAKVAECAFDDRPNSRAGHYSEMDWTDGFRDGTKVAASAIRALQPHGQGGGE